jgi:cytoskeletal protein CcmA (bactofilin family)
MSLFRREHTGASGGGNLDTVLGASASLQGVLKSDGNIRVDGTLKGRIETAGNVVIGPSARVVADIDANSVQVWGHVQGNVRADGRLEILSTGRVFGELHVAALMIDRGGLYRGQCFMSGEDIELLEAPREERLLGSGDTAIQVGAAEQTLSAPAPEDAADGQNGQ